MLHFKKSIIICSAESSDGAKVNKLLDNRKAGMLQNSEYNDVINRYLQ